MLFLKRKAREKKQLFFKLLLTWKSYAFNIQFSQTSAAIAAVLETGTVLAETSTPQIPQGGAGEQQQQEQQQQQHSSSSSTAGAQQQHSSSSTAAAQQKR